MNKICILGGNGFLGTQLCKQAVKKGLIVSSVSRSGLPKTQKIEEWMTKVTWHRADINDSNSYKDALDGQDAVVHTIGALFSFDYKPIIQGKIPDFNKRNKIFDINYKSVKKLMDIASQTSSIKNLAYVSTTPFLPHFMSPDYHSSKKAAEQYLLMNNDPIKKFVFQPALMYSEQRPLTLALSAAALFSNQVCKDLIPSPMAVDHVAEKIIEILIESEKYKNKNILNVQKLK